MYSSNILVPKRLRKLPSNKRKSIEVNPDIQSEGRDDPDITNEMKGIKIKEDEIVDPTKSRPQ